MNPKIVRVRVLLFRFLIVVVFSALSLQLWRLQIIEGREYRLRADNNRFRTELLDAPRGVIYDRHGTIQVRNRPSFTVRLTPANVPDDEVERESEFALLASLLDMPVTADPNDTRQALAHEAFQPLAFPPPPIRNPKGIRQVYQEGLIVPYNPMILKTGVDTETAALISELMVRMPGVDLTIEPARQYLNGPLTAHVLGYVGHIPEEEIDRYRAAGYEQNDPVGLTGVELSYEEQLRGRRGHKTVEVDVSGREVRTVGAVVAPVPGNNVVLTVDADLQRIMESALRKGMEDAKSRSGVAIVMNAKTGEILGLVSLPSFDNNLFASGISTEDYLRLSIDNNRPLVNHAVGGQYPPGSIFKVIPASVALQEGVIDTRQQFICPGTMYLPNRYFPDDPEMAQPFYCWNREGHGPVALLGALAFSCDIYFYELGGGYGDFPGIGLETLANYANAYGLGAYTGIDLPGESKGLIPSAKWKRLTYRETWVTGDMYNMTIGQGFVLTTPLQMLNATNAIANNGTLYRPQIVREVVDSLGNAIRPFEPETIRQIPISPENLAIVREGMRLAVTDGTATNINLPQVTVAGKTGSAEFPGPRDSKGRLPTHAWFTAFAPYEDPQVTLIVFVQGGGEGSLVSVPIAAEILNYIFPTTPENGAAGIPTPPIAPIGAPAATGAITATVPADATPTPKPTPVPAPFRGFWR